MKCELCGTEVKVVGSVTKYYEPVNDTEAQLAIAVEALKDAKLTLDYLSYCYPENTNGYMELEKSRDKSKQAIAKISEMQGD